MNRSWRRKLICAAIAIGSVVLTLLLAKVSFFQILNLKAGDAHFVLRGKRPTRDIVIFSIDDKTEDRIPTPLLFFPKIYGEAIKAAADGGAKVLVLDVAFGISVAQWEPDNDPALAEAFTYASQKMSLVTALVASKADQANPGFAVPINILASAFGSAAMANLTVDADGFVRRQVMIEAPAKGTPDSALDRSMSLHAAEKFLGKEAHFSNGKLLLGNDEIPVDADRNMTINFAGPADTFPKVSLVDVVDAYRSGNIAQLRKWVQGKIVLLGPDDISDRHATPFFTAFGLTNKWETPGVEIHANSILTLLNRDFLLPVAQWGRLLSLIAVSGTTVAIVAGIAVVTQTVIWAIAVLLAALVTTHLLFLNGWELSATEVLLAFSISLVGGIIFRFATAERKGSFFKNAVALFVGKQVATSLEQSEKIALTGKRRMVTILFTDIRGFTAFCESKDPAVIVDLLNVYMAQMCSIIVKYNGHVNKFIGDGILAVFSDDDPNAVPGDHALRAVNCATEMVTAPGEFKTGSGMHSGEVVIGNVGSSDKMEFTVLGDTVNLASRLESLNKEHKTKLLMSGATYEMTGGSLDTLYLGAVPVRGKTEPMKLYTMTSLATEETLQIHGLSGAAVGAKS